MTIWVDTREKQRAVKKIMATFETRGIDVIPHSLPYGDYMSLDNARLSIDRKQALGEVCSNFSDVPKKDKSGKIKRYPDGTVMTERERFSRELSGAQKHGIKMVVLVEHGGSIKTLEDVIKWKNPRLKESPLAISGERLYKLMTFFADKYGITWRFCDKASTGAEIIRILGGDSE